MASYILSSAGWYFLPSLVTGRIQSALYAVFFRAGGPKPAPGSPRFARHRRYIQIVVIIAYLLYTVYEADYQLQNAGDFYRLLKVEHSVTERALTSRFRKLTLLHHPDKDAGPDRAAIEAYYVQLQLARDTLADVGKRFAYERFGPEMLEWTRKCVTRQDFLFYGLQRVAAYYVLSAAALILLSVIGYLRAGMFWRYLALVAMFVVELNVVTRSTFPGALRHVINPVITIRGLRTPYLPFQMVVLMRKLALTVMIAIAQLGPLLQDPAQAQLAAATSGKGSYGVAPQLVDRIDQLVAAMNAELSRLMGMEMTPFMGDEPTRELAASLKDWLMQNTVRNDPEVKAAIHRVLEQRKTLNALDESVEVSDR